MKSKMKIKSIVILATVSIISLFFINMSLAANTAKVSVETANLRETPDKDSNILELLSINKEVEIIEKIDNWYKVKVDGMEGYLREDLLKVNSETDQKANTISDTEKNQDQELEKVTDKEINSESEKRYITEDTKLKIVPVINATDIIEVKKDEEVKVIETVNGWVCVETQTTKGWIRTEKLKDSIQQTNLETEGQEKSNQEINTQTVNKTSYIKSASVNLRKDSNTASEIITTLSSNTEVNVIEELSNGWSKIKVNENEGYVLTSLLSAQKQQTSRSQTTRRTGQTNENSTQTTTITTDKKTYSQGKGSTVIETAKKYLGYRYVYGGTSPATGFDCSGFTSYIFKQHGITLSRTSQAQAKNGVPVNRNNLQPGDLVFFYGGISHVGIYIGGGQFIHASNSRTGVIISTLSSGHYSSSYKCARRVM